MPTVFVSDLDGTLLQPDGTLSSKSEGIVRDALANGVAFTVASARSLFSMRAILGDLPFRLPVLSFNGGYVSDYQTGTHLKVWGIPVEEVSILRQCLSAHKLDPFVSTYGSGEDHLYVGLERSPAMEWFYEERRRENDTRLKVLEDIRHAFTETVTCVSVMGSMDHLSALERDLTLSLGGQVQVHLFENLYARGTFWLTIHPKEATKAQGLEFMLEQTGLSGSKLVVFGDHMNDYEMFQMADEALAVENAEQDLKAVASSVLGPNHEDSVAIELRRRYLAERVI